MRLNLSVMSVLLTIFFITVIKIIFSTASEIQEEVVSRFELTNKAIDAQINYLELHASEYEDYNPQHLLSLFNLEQFTDVNFINVELFDASNSVIASNYNETSVPNPWLVERIEHVFIFGLFHPIDAQVHSIDIANEHQGKAIVSVDIESKLHNLWRKTLTTISPIAFIFALLFAVITMIMTFIIKPLSEFLLAVGTNNSDMQSEPQKLSLVSFFTGLRRKLQGIHHDLASSNQTVHDLNHRILHIQEDERRHLSAELHDELGQHLTAIRFEAEAIKMAKTLDEAKQSAQAIDSIGRNMKDIVRSMLQRLRPPELALFGLKDTLSEMVTDWQQSHPQSHIDFTCQADFSQLDEVKQLNIYRIVQEGLTNISRHAGLTGLNITISLLSEEKQVNILIADDGQGCDLTQPRSGFGLNGMRERVETCGGTISLQSSPKQGMTITIAIPNKSEKDDE